MRFYIFVILLFCSANAQMRFQPEYFINKHNLKLPSITKEMLNISEFSHISDKWIYYYSGINKELDSVERNLTIEGFEPNFTRDIYTNMKDTTYVKSVSISLEKFDTTSMRNIKYTNNFRNKISLNPKTNCIYHSKVDKRGIKLLDVNKCPGENDFGGQVFKNTVHANYIESIEEYRGKIDSNSIRRYYLTPFDSIAADYMVKKGEEPFVVCLNIYNNKNRKQTSYSFDIFSKTHEVFDFDYYTYINNNDLHRVYHFQVKNSKAKIREYELVNYTEYEYDKLGRKTTMITRVKPDPKYQKKE